MTKDAYYVAKSQLQKGIRMGLGADALRAAKILFDDNPWVLFCRLGTILGEDCSRDHELIDYMLHFYEHGHSFKSWDDVSLLVAMMAGSKHKSHECGYGWWSVLFLKGLREPAINADSPMRLLEPDVLVKMSEFKEVLRDDYIATMSKFYDEKKCGKLYDFLRKVDRESQLRLYPLWYHDDGGVAKPAESELFKGIDRRMGPLLLNAIDSHTRAGQMALRVIVKRCPIEIDWDDLRFYEWYSLSSKLNHKVIDGRMEKVVTTGREPIIRWLTENVENIMDVREWAVKKTCPGLIEEFDNV